MHCKVYFTAREAVLNVFGVKYYEAFKYIVV